MTAKRIEKVKVGECCYVEWIDSSYPEGGWIHVSDLETDMSLIHTVGFLVSQDDNILTIAQSSTQQGVLMHVLTIPKVAIERVQNCSF